MVRWYDAGYRAGDFIPMLSGGINDLQDAKFLDYEKYSKIKQFYEGGIVFAQSGYIGEIGYNFFGNFSKLYQFAPQFLSCFQYDGMLLLGNSLDLAVRRGFDFEVPRTFNDMIRLSRFTGCSGAVSFDKSSNNRSFSGFDIQQFEYDEETDSFEYASVATYNPLSTKLFDLKRSFIWPNKATKPPTDTRVDDDTDCPFPDGDETISSAGTAVATVSIFTVIGFSTISS
jgi:hypothetical protein